MYLSQHHYLDAERLWHDVLQISDDWEKAQHKLVHKGTTYYCWAVTSILASDLEKGFLLMHQALEEDKRTFGAAASKCPAHAFVVLDFANQNQLFLVKVQEVSFFLEKRLNEYHSARGGGMRLNEFKSKFLEDPDMEEIVFYFVFQAFRLSKFLGLSLMVTPGAFATELEASILFGLCLTIDNFLSKKNPSKKNRPKKKLSDHLSQFLSANKKLLNLTSDRIGELNKRSDRNLDQTVLEILESRFFFKDGSTLSQIEEDFGILYGLRNFGAHKIEDQPILHQHFEEITQRLFNTLFFLTEKL